MHNSKPRRGHRAVIVYSDNLTTESTQRTFGRTSIVQSTAKTLLVIASYREQSRQLTMSGVFYLLEQPLLRSSYVTTNRCASPGDYASKEFLTYPHAVTFAATPRSKATAQIGASVAKLRIRDSKGKARAHRYYALLTA